jgi:hypothetical protein
LQKASELVAALKGFWWKRVSCLIFKFRGAPSGPDQRFASEGHPAILQSRATSGGRARLATGRFARRNAAIKRSRIRSRVRSIISRSSGDPERREDHLQPDPAVPVSASKQNT